MDINEVFVDSNEAYVFDEATEWCKDNNIAILRYDIFHSENSFDRAMIYGFMFYFDDAEDATAFKLRWG